MLGRCKRNKVEIDKSAIEKGPRLYNTGTALLASQRRDDQRLICAAIFPRNYFPRRSKVSVSGIVVPPVADGCAPTPVSQ